MGEWDSIGRDLLRSAAGDLFGSAAEISLGPGGGVARIDGAVANSVAVEIETRNPKQIRGAVLDLVLHPLPKKLLVVLPIHSGNSSTIGNQARFLLGRFLSPDEFRVVVATKDPSETIQMIRSALKDLGVALAG